MIEIHIGPDEITVRGHSGVKGTSIACEAVTAIVNTYVASLQEIAGGVPEDTILQSGLFTIKTKSLRTEEALILTQAFLIGLKNVSQAYWPEVQMHYGPQTDDQAVKS